jgi:hypothetical protein
MRQILLTIVLGLLLYALYKEYNQSDFYSKVSDEIQNSKSGSIIRDNKSIFGSQIGLDSVKAIVYDKIHIRKNKDQDEQYIFLYKNAQGAIWKIEDALIFWNAGVKGDSIMVYFLDSPKFETVKFYDIKPIKPLQN